MTSIRSSLQEMARMPHGSAKVEAGRDLWNLARQDPDPRLRFEVLRAVIEAATFGGALDYLLVLVPQLVNLRRGHPEAVGLQSYIWVLKWLVQNLPSFPEVPWERIRMAEDEYAREVRNAGGNERTASYLRWKNRFNSGQFEGLAAICGTLQLLPVDMHSDCGACETSSLVREAFLRGDYRSAISEAESIIGGRTLCAEVPHSTFSKLALAAELTGDSGSAAAFHAKGYPLIRSNIKHVEDAGLHLGYLTAANQPDRARRLLKTHISWLDRNRNPAQWYFFLIGATAACRMLAERSSRVLPLDLPHAWTTSWGGEPLPAGKLAERLDMEGRAIASAFDLRNGNNWHLWNFEQMLAKIESRRKSSPEVSQAEQSSSEN